MRHLALQMNGSGRGSKGLIFKHTLNTRLNKEAPNVPLTTPQIPQVNQQRPPMEQRHPNRARQDRHIATRRTRDLIPVTIWQAHESNYHKNNGNSPPRHLDNPNDKGCLGCSDGSTDGSVEGDCVREGEEGAEDDERGLYHSVFSFGTHVCFVVVVEGTAKELSVVDKAGDADAKPEGRDTVDEAPGGECADRVTRPLLSNGSRKAGPPLVVDGGHDVREKENACEIER